jgi:hypothetical protein
MLARLNKSQIVIVKRRRDRSRKSDKFVAMLQRQAAALEGVIGPVNNHSPSGGSTCLDCKRYIEGAYRRKMENLNGKRRPVRMPDGACEWCGR